MRSVFRSLAVVALLGASTFQLAGCGSLSAVTEANAAIADYTVSPEAVIIASNAFDAVQVSATNYLRLKRCNGTNGPLCREPDVTPTIVATIQSGRKARDGLQQFLRDNPGKLGNGGLYNALVAATSTIKGMISTYTTAISGVN